MIKDYEFRDWKVTGLSKKIRKEYEDLRYDILKDGYINGVDDDLKTIDTVKKILKMESDYKIPFDFTLLWEILNEKHITEPYMYYFTDRDEDCFDVIFTLFPRIEEMIERGTSEFEIIIITLTKRCLSHVLFNFGEHFREAPSVNGVTSLIVFNFFNICNKILIDNGYKPLPSNVKSSNIINAEILPPVGEKKIFKGLKRKNEIK